MLKGQYFDNIKVRHPMTVFKEHKKNKTKNYKEHFFQDTENNSGLIVDKL